MPDFKFDNCGFFSDIVMVNTDNQKPVPEECPGIILLKDDIEIHVKDISVYVDEHQNKTGTYGGTIIQIGNDGTMKEYKNLKIGLKVSFKKENMYAPLEVL